MVMRTPTPTLTIGEFGRRSGLSGKALRLYDMSGLLQPAAVDPVTGYRLYTEDQLERARRISMLRQLDMPLAIVAEVLAGSDEQALRRIDRWWATQETSMLARRGSLEYLRARLIQDGREAQRHPVSLRESPAAKVATIRRGSDQQALIGVILTAVGEIREHLQQAGATFSLEWWVIFHGKVLPDCEAPVEICVPFDGRVEPAGAIGIRLEPAHTQAYATVTRGGCYFPQILLAYDAVGDWVTTQGMITCGAPREVYLGDWNDFSDDDPFVHVAQPIER
jgi:DNA-binding transcriptional MerR regulator